MHFAENLKFLRKRRNQSQTNLAADLGITRTSLAGYEKNVQPPFRTLIKFSEHFNISLDALIKYKLEILSEFQFSQIEKGFDVDVTGRKLRLLTISVDSEGKENIEMVPVKAQAGYTNSYGDLEFISTLPKFKLPFLPADKTYRSFQIKGDSMLPVTEGSWVTCSFVENWEQIKNGKACVVVTKDEGIVFKLVYNYLSKRILLLVSINPNYSPFEIPISQVLEIWQFETWNSFEINA
ncbi:MAG: LexA family transcriptional regulator [Prolixibacteraceae bacterium]|jgi:transcriptional regulator with XRE-family HTH domain|nr:LexA family transcriptional regulator [Prolixibacteraceae bacterium]MBT7000935.1 LexA family transcriptional regulator [Prolixibacteraceae bacterium]MBT7397320.1 LexA family transcriptional regulator [Prolixibacteraceae bacterium]